MALEEKVVYNTRSKIGVYVSDICCVIMLYYNGVGFDEHSKSFGIPPRLKNFHARKVE